MRLQDTIYIICNLLSILGLHIFLNKLYPSSSSKTYRRIGLTIYYLGDCVVYVSNDSPYIFFITSILLFGFCSYIYIHNKIVHILIITFIFQVFVVCSELLVAFFLSIRMKNSAYSDNTFVLITIVLSKLLFFTFLFWTSHMIKHKVEHLPTRYIFSSLTMPVLSAIIIIYIFSLNPFDQYSIKDAGSIEAIAVILTMVLINIISCLSIKQQHDYYLLQSEQENLQNIVKMQQEHYEQDLEYRKELGRLRHDFKNFLLGIKTDIASGRISNAIDVIDSKISHYSLSPIPQCNIFAIDATILHKYGEAQNKNIDISVEYKIAYIPQIDSCDISVLIGNAVDNAIEYLSTHLSCTQMIQIKIVCDKGLLDICITNEINTEVVISENNTIISSKSMQHGYGLKSASMIAEKYQGGLFLSCPGNKFIFNAILYC